MSTTPPNLDALAQKYGGSADSGAVDLDALAQKHGGTTVNVTPPTSGGFKQYLSDLVNKPLIPYFANKAKEAGQLEQQQLNQAYGPEADIEKQKLAKGNVIPKPIQNLANAASSVYHQVASVPYAGARVLYGALGMTPMDAAVVAGSTVAGQPEAAGAYFAAKAATEGPQTVKQAIQNPTPENVEAAIGTGATLAGGAAGAMGGRTAGVPSTEEAAGTIARNQATLNKQGLRSVARTVTGVRPAVEDAVARGADRQAKLEKLTGQKNQAAIESHQQAITKTAAENQNLLDEHTFATEEAKQAAAQKNTDAVAQHQAELQRITEENKAAEQTLSLRQKTEAELAGKTQEYYAKEDEAKASSDKANQANWDAWRAKVANTEEDMAPVRDTIERVQARFPEVKQILNETTATPEDMSAANAQFIADRNAVMKQQGYGTDYDSLPTEARAKVDDLIDRLGLKPDDTVPLDTSKPMSMQQIHDLKTQIGWKVYRNEYPPNVAGAMKQVLRSLEQTEVRGSINAGALPELEAARASHQQFQQAFGRSKPTRSLEGEVRKQEANPEAYDAQQEQQRLAAAGQVSPELPAAYQEVAGLRQKVKSLPTEEQLRKGIKQPPEPPVPVEAKLPKAPQLSERPAAPAMKATPEVSVDIQQAAQRGLRERAKNWGHYNARDIGILSSSVALTPIMYFLGQAVLGEHGGASALAPLAAVAYEGGKMGAAKLLRNESFRNWLVKTPPEEIEALSKIPGADKLKVQDGIVQVVMDEYKNGNKVNLSDSVKQFLGPKNLALITAAAQPGKATAKDLKQRLQDIAGN